MKNIYHHITFKTLQQNENSVTCVHKVFKVVNISIVSGWEVENTLGVENTTLGGL
jgi:hypothetical protein